MISPNPCSLLLSYVHSVGTAISPIIAILLLFDKVTVHFQSQYYLCHYMPAWGLHKGLAADSGMS